MWEVIEALVIIQWGLSLLISSSFILDRDFKYLDHSEKRLRSRAWVASVFFGYMAVPILIGFGLTRVWKHADLPKLVRSLLLAINPYRRSFRPPEVVTISEKEDEGDEEEVKALLAFDEKLLVWSKMAIASRSNETFTAVNTFYRDNRAQCPVCSRIGVSMFQNPDLVVRFGFDVKMCSNHHIFRGRIS